MKIVVINYSYQPGFSSPEKWINRIRPSAIILEALAKDHSVSYIGQIGFSGDHECNGVQYHFIDTGKRSRFPYFVHSMAKRLKPDVVLIPGFHFPLQVMQLRLRLGRKVKIILEHHADKPFTGVKKLLQTIADKCVTAYHFTSRGNAQEWIDKNIISGKNKCYEIPANSSGFSGFEKESSKHTIGMGSVTNFLWVGRLHKNKDPLTVIKAFEMLLATGIPARLYLIFQTTELLPVIEAYMQKNDLLKRSITLCGKIPHARLATWYSAADFYISASYNEGGSIALVEAMSCGCIPIVSSIPASLKVIANGKYGTSFEAGNVNELFQKMKNATTVDTKLLSGSIEKHFRESLSPAAIAAIFIRNMLSLYQNNSITAVADFSAA